MTANTTVPSDVSDPVRHTDAAALTSIGEIFTQLAGRIVMRGDDVCFIDWVIGVVFAVVFLGGLLGIDGLSIGLLLDKGALWAAVAALGVTRFAGATSRSIDRFAGHKYGTKNGAPA